MNAGQAPIRLTGLLAAALLVGVVVPLAARAVGFDSIVIDDDVGGRKGNGDYAVGQGPTRKEAERIAMSNCTLGGNVACTVKLTYAQCGAYASSGRRAATGVGATPEAAGAAARSACREEGCRVVVADCVGQPLAPPR